MKPDGSGRRGRHARPRRMSSGRDAQGRRIGDCSGPSAETIGALGASVAEQALAPEVPIAPIVPSFSPYCDGPDKAPGPSHGQARHGARAYAVPFLP